MNKQRKQEKTCIKQRIKKEKQVKKKQKFPDKTRLNHSATNPPSEASKPANSNKGTQ